MESLIGVPVLVGCFGVAMIMGAVVNKTRFCTLGGVSDWVNIGDKGRLGAWFIAIAVAVLGVLLLETLEALALDSTRPPYRSARFAWLRYLLGGLMFGVGMTLASGCISKTLVRFGGGNLKSLVVLTLVGVFAYLMTRTDFYAVLFHSWMEPLSVDLNAYAIPAQDLGHLLAALFGTGLGSVDGWRLLSGLLLIALISLFVMRTAGFRGNGGNWLGGGVVGLAVVAGWWLTAGPWGQNWQEAAEWLDERPLGVAAQSYTFVNPVGETLNYLSESGRLRSLTFGVVAVFGIVLGSAMYALFSGTFRMEWFASWGDFVNHVIGGILMGTGGVLAMGCTIGQGVTGVSTLALGSFIALAAIILGSATTMKIQYYRMLYEDASWLDALLSGWVDLHLLPSSLRRLEAL